jgi:uncharacterized membrane protein YfcA
MMTVIGLVLAALIGIALGLLGGGGAILAVPIFNYVLGFGAKEAIASSLAVVGVTSLSGVASHWREGNVKLRIALAFGLPAAAGAFFGAKVLAGLLSGATQLALFGVVMLVSAFFMFRDNNNSGKDEEKESDGGDSGTRNTFVLLVAVGVGVGILTGLVGVGGGFLIVPALVLLGNVEMKQAVGTSLVVIAANSFSGFLGYLGTVEFQWGLMALFSVLAVVGSFAGGYLTRFVPQRVLRKSFAVFLVLMGIFILYENRQAIPFL